MALEMAGWGRPSGLSAVIVSTIVLMLLEQRIALIIESSKML
jgi:hypothetical protein